ncbi:hypothetical protein HMPREF9136_0344 [Prevotella dentalis DSM 3688]|uniref:Uncharacterized protein n=1 Tax=Prevotella dentalis (strain ATCC 49559 / DSM 3688 / JCM 13448 / NCTC 12043 / ES 2772) TaxID=908937 RepID=F9D0G6_PREDD|nr:hypothetical protein HMPREF9136_0344 [Prevotella dentalis DSM 3688]
MSAGRSRCLPSCCGRFRDRADRLAAPPPSRERARCAPLAPCR